MSFKFQLAHLETIVHNAPIKCQYSNLRAYKCTNFLRALRSQNSNLGSRNFDPGIEIGIGPWDWDWTL